MADYLRRVEALEAELAPSPGPLVVPVYEGESDAQALEIALAGGEFPEFVIYITMLCRRGATLGASSDAEDVYAPHCE